MSEIFNPAGEVQFKLFDSEAAAWIHPAYALRKMEYVLPDGRRFYCPLLGRNAKRLLWRLDKDLHMIPGSVVVE